MKTKSTKKLMNLTLITMLSISASSGILVYAENDKEEQIVENEVNQIKLDDEATDDGLMLGEQSNELEVSQKAVEDRVNPTLDGWKYTENHDYITLIYYEGGDVSVTIPGEYKGKPVVFNKPLKNLIPKNVFHLKFQTVNNRKVKYQSTSMNKVFADLTVLQRLDLSGLDTSHVTDMSEMFLDSTSLTHLNLSGLDTSKVTNMSNMFRNLTSLTSLDLKSLDTSRVTDMSHMFRNLNSLTSLDLKSFDTSRVTDMSYMFANVKSLKTLDLSSFNTSRVTNMMWMFDTMTSLTSLNIKSFDTSNVTTMREMFCTTSSLTSLDLSHFDTSNVTDMALMFYNTESLVSLDLSSFDTSNVTTMYSMFKDTPSLKSLDLSHFDTSNVTNMESMFAGASSLKSLNLSAFDTSNVKDMGEMFSGMTSLTSLDINSFNTSNVIRMSSMFSEATSLTSLDLSHFNTSSVTSMAAMFDGMTSLTSLNLNGFDTSNVTLMRFMFADLPSLKSLDLSHFNTSNVIDMRYMFKGLESLKVIDLSSFDILTSSMIDNMFYCDESCEDLIMIARDPILVSKNFNPENRKVLKLSYNNEPILSTTTIIKGLAIPSTTIGIYADNNRLLTETTADVDGEYQLTIPQQPMGTILELKMFQNGSAVAKTKIEVLREFDTFSYNVPSSSTTIIKGKGVVGANINIYSAASDLLATTVVDSKGDYQLTIPKQRGGRTLTFKQSKKGYLTLSEKVKVLNEFETFTIKNTSTSSVAIYGTGEPGAKVKAFVGGKAISSLTQVNSKGNYKIEIPKQKAGTVVQVKMAKLGYLTTSKNITVLNEFNTFTIKTTPTSSTTAIYGTGVAGSKVGVYTQNGTRLALTTVNSKGNYKLVIPKQKAGTVLTVKQAKSGYLTTSKNVTVLNEFKTFSITTKINSKTTAIYGKGIAGAKVGIYDKNGKRLAITTVNSKGNYKLTIPKQKAGTKLVLKQAKSGYLTVSKNVTVVKG